MLKAERLRLRPFDVVDSPIVSSLAGVPDVASKTLNIPYPYPNWLAETWIKGQRSAAADGRVLTWAVVRTIDDALMGAVSLTINRGHARGELGYWIGVAYWNHGYATEAARRVIEHGFTEIGLNRIHATCLPSNVASSSVLEKAGMLYEGLLRGYYCQRGTFVDVSIYAVVRTDSGWR